MVLVPVLLAGLLFLAADRSADRTGKSVFTSAQEGAEEPDTVGEIRAAELLDADGEPAAAELADADGEGQAEPDREADQTETEAGQGVWTGEFSWSLPEEERTGPLQDLAFTDGGREARVRSIPVQIDAVVLGGQQGEKCWAVFLPAEMGAHPHLVFSKYSQVELEPLEEFYSGFSGFSGVDDGTFPEENIGYSGAGKEASDGISGKTEAEEKTLNGNSGNIGTVKESSERSRQETGVRSYRSGEEAEGLINGSLFRVRMISAEGDVQEEDLYVFSCTGTATMYLDTESGSMAAVDADETKQTSEEAQFLVCTPDGQKDSSGTCKVSGRGNSTWHMKKRPYNLNLSDKQSVLGMGACKKLCLLANTFDLTNLLDRISAQIALSLGMRDTPEGEFVNLYLNGQYNGLYYLSQRVRTGGSVQIKKLDKRILEANGQSKAAADSDSAADPVGSMAEAAEETGEVSGAKETSAEGTASGDSIQLPKRIALHAQGDRLKKWAYDWPNEPADNTGGYLLQQYEGYDGTDCWFSTNHRRFRIMSPAWPTVGEVEYLQDYMLAAERAIYSEDGKDPETGKPYTAFLDRNSWQDMFLLEEFFAEWDAERWSFFITKDRDDPLLYCGPMWDFDHSAGTMLYGIYPETAVSMLLFRDTRHGWMYKLLSHEEFTDSLHRRWQERFSPLIHRFLEERMEEEISAISSAAYMNNVRRANDVDFRQDAEELKTWLSRRAAFLDDYAGHADAYCRVEFQFPWGILSHYVRRGEPLGYLPLPEFGETQIPSQVEKNEIIGWQDEEENMISEGILIDRDRVFTAVCR